MLANVPRIRIESISAFPTDKHAKLTVSNQVISCENGVWRGVGLIRSRSRNDERRGVRVAGAAVPMQVLRIRKSHLTADIGTWKDRGGPFMMLSLNSDLGSVPHGDDGRLLVLKPHM